MSIRPGIISWKPKGSSGSWRPTTLTELGKSEEFFEGVLAEYPDLLQQQSRRTGIRGPFCVFRQLSLRTPSGRQTYPDITILSASGHVIVVEVKRSSNQELRDRSVIAQIIDYASSFANLDDEEVLALFDSTQSSQTWGDLIARLFPDETDHNELAHLLLERMSSGQTNLVIVCDDMPPGLSEIVRGVAQQNSLGFDLDVVVVTPYVRESDDEILFVPATAISTEIVARTAITVTYREGDARPSTHIEATSIEDIEDNIRDAGETRVWSAQETEATFIEEGNPEVLALLRFAKDESLDGQIVSPAPKKLATFGFYMPIVYTDGSVRPRMVFSCTKGWIHVTIYLSRLEKFVPADVVADFRTRLNAIFESDVNLQTDPNISYSDLPKHVDELKELILWFRDSASAG